MPDASSTRLPRADVARAARRRGRARIRIAGVALGLTTAIVAALVAFDVGGSARPVAVSVSIDVRHPGARIPREFLGLSFEVSSLGQIAHLGSTGNFARMLRSLGAGVLRF